MELFTGYNKSDFQINLQIFATYTTSFFQDWHHGRLTDNNNNNDRLTAFDPGQPG